MFNSTQVCTLLECLGCRFSTPCRNLCIKAIINFLTYLKFFWLNSFSTDLHLECSHKPNDIQAIFEPTFSVLSNKHITERGHSVVEVAKCLGIIDKSLYRWKVLNVNRSGYYAWRNKPESARALNDVVLLGEIKQFFDASGNNYGSPHTRYRSEPSS